MEDEGWRDDGEGKVTEINKVKENDIPTNSRNAQSEPCQFRSQVHISWGPHWPWPEHALGHSARAMPSDAIAATATRRLPEILIAFAFSPSKGFCSAPRNKNQLQLKIIF
jgi:hypothetical protein